MLTLSYGFRRPQVPDQGGIVFPALEANWQQVNDHNHDGVNSALISGLSLPAQPGNAGRFLTTNGVTASWAVVETITASNVGGAVGLFKQKTLSDLEFKSIEAGTNITLDTTNPSKVTINASGGGGAIRKTSLAHPAGNAPYGALAESAINLTILSDPHGLVTNGSNSTVTVPLSFVGTVRVTVDVSLSLTSPNAFTNWQHFIIIREQPSNNILGITAHEYKAEIVAGSYPVPAGKTGSPQIRGSVVFNAAPGGVFRVFVYTNKAIVIEASSFQTWMSVSMEQIA